MTLSSWVVSNVSRWQAIVFDLDDTLYPESAFVLSGFRAVAAWAHTHLGIDKEEGLFQLCTLFEQGFRGNTFNIWLEQCGFGALADGIVPLLVEVYRQHQPDIEPFPEVPHVLVHLHPFFSLGLVSDGDLGMQQRKWRALGLSDFFDAVVFSDYWGRGAWKPSTTPFLAVLDLLGVAPDAGVYVGDNPIKDFLGANQIGMTTVWVRRSQGQYAHLEPPSDAYAPDYVISSLEDLKDLVLGKLAYDV
jgi:putative hydrolase of the HAD superfamily